MDSNRLPLYLALAQTLRQEIDAKKYKIGALLPPEDQLVVKYGVSRHTVRQALRELKDEGLITSKAGIGTAVSSRSDAAQYFIGI
jgi:DNA-binding GntR family transcriptional regulator